MGRRHVAARNRRVDGSRPIGMATTVRPPGGFGGIGRLVPFRRRRSCPSTPTGGRRRIVTARPAMLSPERGPATCPATPTPAVAQ
jgi:hypothetical protein